jgi:hypothetical protein
MKSRLSHPFTLCLVAFLLLAGLPVSAQNDEVIGRVLMASGTVEAESPEGVRRQLLRRSEVYIQDTILTGANSATQIRMVDSAQIALKENTQFSFDEYSFDGEGGEGDQAVMNLVRGGFRTIDGFIGSDNADEYRVDTQYASIGVRGTTHEAVIDDVLDALFTGVYDGGEGFDFSRTERGQAPQGLQ